MLIQKITQGVEKLHAQTLWGDGQTKTKIYCQGTIYWRCVLAVLRTIKLGPKIKQNHWSIL